MTTVALRGAFLAAALALTATLGACNTAEGVGEDVESAGEGMQDAAKDVKRKM